MAWVYLLVAGLFEIVWPLATKYSNGLHRPVATAVALATIIGNILSAECGDAHASGRYGLCSAMLLGTSHSTSIASSLLFGEGSA